MSGPWILGIGASHNGSACLLNGSEIVAAVQEERLTGVKRASVRLGADSLSVRYCLEAAGLEPRDLDAVGISALPARDTPSHELARNPLFARLRDRAAVVAVGHHLAHAASAHALSGWSDAAVLVIDGAGSPPRDLDDAELRATVEPGAAEAISIYRARGTDIAPVAKHMIPGAWLGPSGQGMRTFASLGAMYSAVAEQVFGDVLAAGKVMGLAAYGQPSIPVREFLTIDGGRVRFTSEVAARFPHDDRWPKHAESYADLAASVQAALETALAAVLAEVRERAGEADRLSYAGGVALNAVANEKVVHRAGFRDVFIAPPAEDSGLAVGAAYLALWRGAGEQPPARRLRRDSLGRPYGEADIEAAVQEVPGVTARRCPDVVWEACRRLAAGEVVGWFQDGSELGPRALGQRSLLCDPRDPDAKARLNAKVKLREGFRPFAPLITERALAAWFEIGEDERCAFMLRAVPFRGDRADAVPAVRHEDGTGRVQSVAPGDNPLLHRLLEEWEALSGVPILVNTSFNLAGEPIVESPEHAVRSLLASEIDCCVLGSWVATRRDGVSLLDLHPVRVASSAARNGDSTGTPYAVSTRWGETTVVVDPDDAALVEAATGEATGRDLVAAHVAAGGERAGLRVLHRLGRLGLLEFRGEPAVTLARARSAVA